MKDEKNHKLLSLPPGFVDSFHEVSGLSREEYFVSSDPKESRLGSGGGTIHLLRQAWKNAGTQLSFDEWLAQNKRILIHAGGQSRRLPAYAPVGKVLVPLPVFRWARGQRIDQTLLSLQLPLFERLCEMAGEKQHTLVCCGDALVTTTCPIPSFNTEADVVCLAIGTDASTAQNHGTFICRRNAPARLDYMLQKPTPATLANLSTTHFYLIDVGIWLLSDRAVERLAKKFDKKGCYDLYGEFGCALGENPSMPDDDLSDLTVEIVSLKDGDFYHFGTTRDLINSTLRMQNIVKDGRDILHLGVKPHPSIFTQNCVTPFAFSAENEFTWIENCILGKDFAISHHNVVTGVPTDKLRASLEPGQCLDIVPMGECGFAVRAYQFDDKMAGERQFAQLYGIAENIDELQAVTDWALKGEGEKPARMISASDISDTANLVRLQAQRTQLMKHCLVQLIRNYQRSVFYQLDLHHVAQLLDHTPELCDALKLDEIAPLTKRISNAMLLGELGNGDGSKAFDLLREQLTFDVLNNPPHPTISVASDQIVWARCPVRIDLAGGWTDTPPYCMLNGGDVVNMAIELNSQPPLQVYVKPCAEPKIIIRSIDMGVSETITTQQELQSYATVGSAFSIPKAALVLAGFGRQNLETELNLFGCGIEITLLSAIPAGSGLGTSSILASTVLSAISDFAGLGWDKTDVCNLTLVLEQMLTTGGGWQDQYGGVLHGVKRLTTQNSMDQSPEVRWLPDSLFTAPEQQPLHLLYYTGVRRTAKHILAEIVRGMFLQNSKHMAILSQMRENTSMLYDALLRGRMDEYGQCLRRTWTLNKRLDSGTNPPVIEHLTDLIDDLCLGYKLPGAGGGGYLYMVAKDLEAAHRIHTILEENKPAPMARFVKMTVSNNGLQISRS